METLFLDYSVAVVETNSIEAMKQNFDRNDLPFQNESIIHVDTSE